MKRYYVTIGRTEHEVKLQTDDSVLLNGHSVTFDLKQLDERSFSILVNGTTTKVIAQRTDQLYQLLINGRQIEATAESERERLLKQFDNRSSAVHHRAEIRAPMPALVVKVEVDIGEAVAVGQGLVILEAMKMENEIKTHHNGTVKEVLVTKGMTVEKGELLIVVEQA